MTTRKYFTAVFLAIAVAAGPQAVLAGGESGPTPVTLAPIAHHEASLTIGGTAYAPADLEAFGAYRLKTKTPWRAETAEFDGVLLADVLAAHGLADAPAVRITAENDYSVIVPREAWTTHNALLATRVDGRAHTRRARGPIQIVFDYDHDDAVRAKAFEKHWVWMASRIEAAE